MLHLKSIPTYLENNVDEIIFCLFTVVPTSAASGLISSSGSSSTSITGSGSTANLAPILSHQYIMGQSVPYATFQQPHVYSYEDLQIMQQRIPHMVCDTLFSLGL